MTKFRMIQEKYKKAQAERLKELTKKQKELKEADTDTDTVTVTDADPFLGPPEIKQPSVAEAKKLFNLEMNYKERLGKLELIK